MDRVATSSNSLFSPLFAVLLICTIVCRGCECGKCSVNTPVNTPAVTAYHGQSSGEFTYAAKTKTSNGYVAQSPVTSPNTGSAPMDRHRAPCIGGGRYTEVPCREGISDDRGGCSALAYFKDAATSTRSVAARSQSTSSASLFRDDDVVDTSGRLLIADRNASTLVDFIGLGFRSHKTDSDRSTRTIRAAAGSRRSRGDGGSRRCAANSPDCSPDPDFVPTVLVLFLSWSERSRHLAPLYSALSRSYPAISFVAVDVVQLCIDDPHGCSTLFTPGPGKICAFANDVVVFDAVTLRTFGVYKTSSSTTLRSLITFFADVTDLQPAFSTVVLPYDDWLKPSTGPSTGTLSVPWIKLVMSVIAIVSCAACIIYIGYVASRPVSGFIIHTD